MSLTYKIATININGISSRLKIYMLRNFLMRQDIYIALLQEVTKTESSLIYGYDTHLNVGVDHRGTAIIVKEGLTLTNIKRLPSGRGIAGLFNDTCLVNIYAPSGAGNRQERENFFYHDLAYLLATCQKDILLAGDFNCVLSPSDCTGAPNISRALSSVINGLALHDAWESQEHRTCYTHYTNDGATRLEYIYIYIYLHH